MTVKTTRKVMRMRTTMKAVMKVMNRKMTQTTNPLRRITRDLGDCPSSELQTKLNRFQTRRHFSCSVLQTGECDTEVQRLTTVRTFVDTDTALFITLRNYCDVCAPGSWVHPAGAD